MIYSLEKLFGVTRAFVGGGRIKPRLCIPQSFCIDLPVLSICLFVNSQSRDLEPPLNDTPSSLHLTQLTGVPGC